MKQLRKRVLPLLLALCMLPGLAACGSGGKDRDNDAEDLSATVYVPEFIDLDFLGKNGSFNGGCTDGKYVYLLVYQRPDWEAGEEGDPTYSVLRMPLGGGETEPLENFRMDETPEGYDYAYSGLSGLSAGAGGTIWVEEYIGAYAFDLPESFDPEKENYWDYEMTDELHADYRIQLDSTGNEITRIDVSELQEKVAADSFYVNGDVIDGDGDIFVCTDEKIVALDSSLNIRFTLEGKNLWGSVTLLSDGSVGAVVTESDPVTNSYSRRLQTIDKSAKDWGEAYDLPTDVYEVYSGTGDYLFYYMKGESLYGYKSETEEGEDPNTFIINLLDADISSDSLQFFSFLEDDRMVIMAEAYGMNSSGTTLAVLTPTPRDQIPEKTVLTYAVMYLGQDERNRIVDFNRTNTRYRIQVKDYSEYRTDDDYMAGIQKLNTEILAGQVPDIINVYNLPIRQYGAKGLLEDLWPYIDSDPDIGGRAGLMERVFTAAEQDGKLYQAFDTFAIATIVGAKSVVGDRNSWTLAELQAALDSMPEGCALFNDYNTKSDVLQMVLYMNLDSFLDWNEGKCYFDTDQFKNLLAFSNNFPLEYDWESNSYGEWDDEYTRISEGRQMLMQESINQFQDIQMQKAVFGGDISYVGFPVEDGSVGSAFVVQDGLVMSSACKDKEGAWSFMRQLLLPRYADQEDDRYFHMYGLPTNKADFDWAVKQAMTPDGYETDENGEVVLDEDGNPVETSHSSWGIGNGSLTIRIYSTKQEEYDQIMDLYHKVDRMAGMDSSVYEIVNEVAGSYFAGDRSLDDAASLIQNKVTTYVNESR